MASATQCDRCGEFFSGNNISVKDINRTDLNGFPGTSLNRVSVYGLNNDRLVSYDLCSDCWKDFFRFIDNNDTQGRETDA